MTCSADVLEQTAKGLHTFCLDLQSDRRRWEAFIASHPDAVAYHHPTWLTALEREYGQKCVSLACEDSSGELRAVLPLFLTKGLPFGVGRHATGRRLSSLPRTPIAGPVAKDADAAIEILRAAIEYARAQHAQLEIKTQLEGLELLVKELVCLPWRFTHVAQLPPPSDGIPWEEFCEHGRLIRECGVCEDCTRLRFGNARKQHRVKWAANKALRSGLRVRSAEDERDLKEWYPLYLQTLQPNAVPPRPYRFFATLWSTMRPAGMMRFAVAEQQTEQGARMVAGSILLGFGQTEFYSFTGCAPADFGLHPHDIIQLDSIRAACKAGFRWYDFGEVPEEHEELNQFKGKWGTEPKRLYRYYYPNAPAASSEKPGRLTTSARKLWRKLPLRATEALGDLLYRYM